MRRSFKSILFPAGTPARAVLQPDFFPDLNLDQVVSAAIASRQAYDLAAFFWRPLRDPEAIRFRQEVMRDVESGPAGAALDAFSISMQAVRDARAGEARSYYPQERERWRLAAAWAYVQGVRRLAQALSQARVASDGLQSFAVFLTDYVAGATFGALSDEAQALTEALAGLRYEVLVDGLVVQVRGFSGADDYSRAVGNTFARFQRADIERHNFRLETSASLNHVDGQILEKLAELKGDLFARLAAFRTAHTSFVEPTIERFEREIQVYLAWRDFQAPLKAAGLSFCYPALGDARQLRSGESFDVALAAKLVGHGKPVVCNDWRLSPPERIIIVSGPNQGGKTTFARTFAQLHYLASLGLPVAGREAMLFAPDRVFTHFEHGERTTSLRGKLQDDLLRVREILTTATLQSVVVINEIFASTTLDDAIFLTGQIAEQLVETGAVCVWVTFIEETAGLSPAMVSMASTVEPDDPTVRTFRVVRRPPDGMAHALSIVQKRRLTRQDLLERLS